jgi:hypothetical protein
MVAFAQVEDGVPPGFDIWRTAGDGNTFYSMEKQPIPSGFFCEDSAAFTGTLYFEGVPIETYPEGVLGKADTIIERLDFAPYDENGLTYSRMVARALNLKAQPFENECGTWDVDVSLAKSQPVTQVTYARGEENYGHFSADLVLNFRMTFTLRGKENVKRELVRTIHFSSFTEIPYAVEIRSEGFQTEKRAGVDGVSFDSNGDGIPDTQLNFAPYREFPTNTVIGKATTTMAITTIGSQICHIGPDHQHCIEALE